MTSRGNGQRLAREWMNGSRIRSRALVRGQSALQTRYLRRSLAHRRLSFPRSAIFIADCRRLHEVIKVEKSPRQDGGTHIFILLQHD